MGMKNSSKINKEIRKIRSDFQNICLKNKIWSSKLLNTKDFKLETHMLQSIPPLTNDLNHQQIPESINDTRYNNKSEETVNLTSYMDFGLIEDNCNSSIKNNYNFNENKPITNNPDEYKNEMNINDDNLNAKISCDFYNPIDDNEKDIMNKDQINKTQTENLLHISTKLSISSNKINEEEISELQSLLIMMAISPKSSPNVEESKYTVDQVSDTNSECLTLIPKSLKCDKELDVLRIVPIRIEFTEQQKYLLDKYTKKWRERVKNKKENLIQQRKKTLNSFFDKLKKKKKEIDQSSGSIYKAKSYARDFNNYQHRYTVQKHIIALQKAKLEEQHKIIEELKYNKIVDASRKSVDLMRKEFRETYYDIDKQLKPKIKCLTNELKIHDVDASALVLQCLKVPQFIQRMEKRAREREEKHAMIRERRKQMEELRIRHIQQAELAKAEMDKDEKIKRIKELKQKRKKEKLEIIRRKEMAERIRALTVMADLHYERKLLLRYGIGSFKKLLLLKADNNEKAESHYTFQLKKNVFLNWMWYTEDMWFERNYKAEECYRRKLLKKCFTGFKQNYYEYTLKKQVAEDYYDLYVTVLVFRKFRVGLQILKKEYDEKLHKAEVYHNSNILFKTFTCWRTLPALNALKREQDARKARWREKVLLVVPDYTPPED